MARTGKAWQAEVNRHVDPRRGSWTLSDQGGEGGRWVRSIGASPHFSPEEAAYIDSDDDLRRRVAGSLGVTDFDAEVEYPDEDRGDIRDFVSVIGMAVAPVVAGQFGAVAGALTKAGFSAASGGNPIQSGALSLLSGAITGGGGELGDLSTTDLGGGYSGLGQASAGMDGFTYAADVGTQPGSATVSNVGDDGITSSFQSLDAPPPESIVSADAYSTDIPGGPADGIIDRVMQWANANPGGARIAAGLGAGALGVAGGIGSALLNRDTAEKRMRAYKELLSQRTAEEAKAMDNKRAFVQGGSYFDTKGLPVAPAATQPLRRPDGSLVYAQPGIISGAMMRRGRA